MSRNQVLGALLCAGAIVIGATLGRAGGPVLSAAPVDRVVASTVAAGVPTIAVHVSGWVVAPGVVEVGEGAIVADAIAAAGGARLGADLDAINLAAPVMAGDQVAVPGPGEAGGADGGAAAPGSGGNGKISLNRADATALQDLPGVGPVLAERIVAYRDANGPFSAVEDLLEVSGIGEAKLAAIRDLVTVP